MRQWQGDIWFIVLCILVFVYSLTPWASSGGIGDLQRWIFRPNLHSVLARPWTLISYVFVHGDLIHLSLNLLGLNYLYHRLKTLDQIRLALLGLGSTILGALCYLIGAALLSSWGIYYEPLGLGGASSILFGLYTFCVLLTPQAEVCSTPWGVLRLWQVGLILIAFSLVGRSNIGGLLAHLGGIISGGLCYWLWAYKSPRGQAPEDENRRRQLIERVRRSGIHSLTPEERKWLMRHKRQGR